jgi:hypothetical protein
MTLDCTEYCGPELDGRLCLGCSMPLLWSKVLQEGTLAELKLRANQWTGDYKEDGAPKFAFSEIKLTETEE